ncbi:MAG: acyltransferase [Alphaproteobacteria bacterium]|nr:MAG: acyltransferase [Alphaproteobacteria bacterium]
MPHRRSNTSTNQECSAVTASDLSSPEGSASHPRYQPYVDGLRAVAVVPVILYHAGFTTFSGGFIGVDVFFVISGYLITTLIMNALDAGAFSLLNFYERRIRRIFPALLAVVCACAIAAWFLFMPVEFAYFGRSMIAAGLFASNILFWNESGYFDTIAQLKPLLHTWSLAVEEQFYIFFPLLLMLLHKIGRFRLAIALAVLSLLSFGLNVWASEHKPEFAFYLSPPRFWELFLGALLALGMVPKLESSIANQILAFIGLGLIIFAVFAFSDATTFPGIAALAPCLGAALIIYSGSQNGMVVSALSARPVVFLGLISYSLYLWHWPIIVFIRYFVGGNLSAAQVCLILSLSLVISILSWRWIEQPFRRKEYPISRTILMKSAAAAIAAAVIFGFFVNVNDGLASRLPAKAAEIYSTKTPPIPDYEGHCFVYEAKNMSTGDSGRVDLCPLPLGAHGDQPAQFIVWGDSHAGAMAPAIGKAALAAGQFGFLKSEGTCPPLLDFDSGVTKREKVARCKLTNQATMDFILTRRIPLVFMVARWPRYVHRAEYGNEGVFFDPSKPIPLDDYSVELSTALNATLATLTRNGIKTVLVMDVPEIGYDVPQALAKAVLTHSSIDIAPSPEAVRRRQALAMKVLAASASKYQATIVDPTPEFCDEKRCVVEKNGIILYSDADHLSQSGAKSISHIFDAVFANNIPG